MPRHSTAARHAFREAFTGAALRTLMGIADAGEAILARVKNAAGGTHYNTDGDADVWIDYVDELTGYPGKARLHVPGNVLFSLPDEEDTALVIRPRDVDAPGVPYLVHGDGGAQVSVPSWLASKVGLFTKKLLRLESSQDAVEIQAGAGKDVTINGGTLAVARETDTVDRNAAMVAWMTAVEGALTSAGHPVATPFAGTTIATISSGAPNVKA